MSSGALIHGAHDGGTTLGWVLVVLVIAVPSVWYAGAVHARRAGGRTWSGRRTTSFVLGVLLVAVAFSPPAQAAAHGDPRGHMAQHLVLAMFAPLALVLGAPMTLLLGTLRSRGRRRASRLLRSRLVHGLAHPLTAAVFDMGALFVLYLTPLYALAAGNAWLHSLVAAHFLAAGYLFTWSIAGADPAPRRPSLGTRVTVLVAAAAAHAYLAKVLYAGAGALPPGSGDDAAAARSAALLMYYGGDLAEILLAVALFAAWYRRRRPVPSSPAATIADVGPPVEEVCLDLHHRQVPGPARARRSMARDQP